MSEKKPLTPANDNACPHCRKAVNELPRGLPLNECELSLIETRFGAMIAETLNEAANDNAPPSDPGKGSEP